VTNNVIGMYCYEAVLKRDWLSGHPGISEEARKEHIEKIKKSDTKFATWKSDPFLALTIYIQLIQEFGWESWRKYLHSFADASFGPAPKSDDEKRDQFLVRYSKIANKNLGPLFDAWGIIVSSSAKAEVSNLGAWMPKGMK
jgi:Peptidase M60, enhancin and enhancin-like